jgi:hypothetical protein
MPPTIGHDVKRKKKSSTDGNAMTLLAVVNLSPHGVAAITGTRRTQDQ